MWRSCAPASRAPPAAPDHVDRAWAAAVESEALGRARPAGQRGLELRASSRCVRRQARDAVGASVRARSTGSPPPHHERKLGQMLGPSQWKRERLARCAAFRRHQGEAVGALLGRRRRRDFTDAVLLADGELRTAKVPTSSRQEESVLAAVVEVGAREVDRFTHGTTVATNALLERKGARTAFVATAGFEHLLHLRRQDRAHLYRLCAAHPEPLVPLERCVGVRERMGPDGVLEPLDLGSLPELDPSVEAVAVCLLFSFRDPAHERAVAEELRRRLPGTRVVASHEVSPEFREYERASTAATDAYLGPVVSRYLEALGEAAADAALPEPLVMRSSGGVAALAEAAAHPSVAVVSGPAAGVVGAARVARAAGVENAISFDMGGTSTDVCLIRGGEGARSGA